jgi:hypothetical protein
MSQQRKNVIIAGSTKCGTTSLFNYLRDHPSICASVIKETRFFWNNEYELSPFKKNKDITDYDDFFLKCPETMWKLEATPDYLYSRATAKKIKAALPDCRLLFILRNPVDRIFSWFKYSRQLGFLPPQFQLNDYMDLLIKWDNKSPAHFRALEQGKYASYLQNYMNLFEEKNILIVLYNDLQNTPGVVMNVVCDFLKIDASHYKNYHFKIYNPSINFKDGKQPLKYIRLKQFSRKFANRLPRILKKPFKSFLKPVDTLYLKTASFKWEEINLSDYYKNRVKEYYREDHELLEKICKKKIVW